MDTHFCIPDADLLIPRHNKIKMPVRAKDIKNRGRVRRTTTALQGGSRALVDFHVTPPLGRSIFAIYDQRMRCDWRGTVRLLGNRHGLERARIPGRCVVDTQRRTELTSRPHGRCKSSKLFYKNLNNHNSKQLFNKSAWLAPEPEERSR